jgi:hypothetical protein
MNLEEYYSTQEKASELTQYIHENYKLIMTKMLSEMRRKLDIDTGTNEYYTLMVGLMSRFFHEITMAMAGVCQSVGVQGSDFIHPDSLKIFLDVYEGKDVLNGRIISAKRGGYLR